MEGDVSEEGDQVSDDRDKSGTAVGASHKA